MTDTQAQLIAEMIVRVLGKEDAMQLAERLQRNLVAFSEWTYRIPNKSSTEAEYVDWIRHVLDIAEGKVGIS